MYIHHVSRWTVVSTLLLNTIPQIVQRAC